jgi:hypothetical protein
MAHVGIKLGACYEVKMKPKVPIKYISVNVSLPRDNISFCSCYTDDPCFTGNEINFHSTHVWGNENPCVKTLQPLTAIFSQHMDVRDELIGPHHFPASLNGQ